MKLDPAKQDAVITALKDSKATSFTETAGGNPGAYAASLWAAATDMIDSTHVKAHRSA